jgi:hypothetical protein
MISTSGVSSVILLTFLTQFFLTVQQTVCITLFMPRDCGTSFATDASVPFSLHYGGGFLYRFASAADECGVAMPMLIKAYCQVSATQC